VIQTQPRSISYRPSVNTDYGLFREKKARGRYLLIIRDN
jgi:hypothetical protein